ncbi:MAG: glycosyltransferase [Parasphingorhabdus sp.]
MPAPLLTIITVVLNGETEIAQTIKSVRSQTFRDFEHLIIDGKSSDRTIKIAESLSYENLEITSQKDTGIYDAMNTGIDHGKGDFCLFLNCGDILPSEETLERMVAKIEEKEVAVFGSVRIKSSAGSWYYPPLETVGFHREFLPHHQSVLYPRSFLNRNKYDLDFKIQADIDFTTRLKREYEIRYLNELLVVSTLGGTTVAIFPYFEKAMKLAAELVSIKIKIDGQISSFGKLKIYTNQFLKHGICKFLGTNSLFRTMRWSGKRALARSTYNETLSP